MVVSKLLASFSLVLLLVACDDSRWWPYFWKAELDPYFRQQGLTARDDTLFLNEVPVFRVTRGSRSSYYEWLVPDSVITEVREALQLRYEQAEGAFKQDLLGQLSIGVVK